MSKLGADVILACIEHFYHRTVFIGSISRRQEREAISKARGIGDFQNWDGTISSGI